jgi:hypothetical protein
MENDPSRLVNSASGGNFYPVGQIMDLHNYPDPAMPHPDFFGKQQILVLGEYGGLGLPVEGHTWQQKDNWGYQSFKNFRGHRVDVFSHLSISQYLPEQHKAVCAKLLMFGEKI